MTGIQTIQIRKVPLRDVGRIGNEGLRSICNPSAPTVVEFQLNSVNWTGLVFCSPIDHIWGALPVWWENRTGKLAEWVRGNVESDYVYKQFLGELRVAGIRKEELSRGLTTYQAYGGYGTSSHGPFGAKAQTLYDCWFQPCTIPSGTRDLLLAEMEKYWRVLGSASLVSYADQFARESAYIGPDSLRCDYGDAQYLSWGIAAASSNRALRESYFIESAKRLRQLIDDSNGIVDLVLHPLHVSKPPLSFMNWSSFPSWERPFVDECNALKSRLVRQSGMASFASAVAQVLEQRADDPSMYEPLAAATFSMLHELDAAMTKWRTTLPLLFDDGLIFRSE